MEDRDEYDKAAEFIVYRGAPGCGKTSLVKHLRHMRSDDALFVEIDLDHLASAEALIGRVLEQAAEAGSLGSRIGGKFVQALGSKLRMRDVARDADGIRQESERNRHGYYLGRLDHPVLSKHRPVTLSVIAEIPERRPASIGELGRLCREQMDLAGWPDLADPDELAYALVEKGAVSADPDGTREVPIPSMSDWAASLTAG